MDWSKVKQSLYLKGNAYHFHVIGPKTELDLERQRYTKGQK